MAEEYFEQCLPSAQALEESAAFYIGKDRLKEAAFSRHQATERYYHCSPAGLHLLHASRPQSRLSAYQAERIDPRLIEVWPRETKSERRRFEKLKEAYVKARYSRHYRISEEELA